jgi:hypothetical protein
MIIVALLEALAFMVALPFLLTLHHRSITWFCKQVGVDEIDASVIGTLGIVVAAIASVAVAVAVIVETVS